MTRPTSPPGVKLYPADTTVPQDALGEPTFWGWGLCAVMTTLQTRDIPQPTHPALVAALCARPDSPAEVGLELDYEDLMDGAPAPITSLTMAASLEVMADGDGKVWLVAEGNATNPGMPLTSDNHTWIQMASTLARRVAIQGAKKVLEGRYPEVKFGKALTSLTVFLDVEEHFKEAFAVARVGAIAARNGQVGLIPHGGKVYVVQGLGHADSYMSATLSDPAVQLERVKVVAVLSPL